MLTVQLAISNMDWARSVVNLLNGQHNTVMVARPDLSLPGVIVSDARLVAEMNSVDAERFVVVAPKSGHDLVRLWESGFRRVILDSDTPHTAYLAILAAGLNES